jgi:hypothetical protein
VGFGKVDQRQSMPPPHPVAGTPSYRTRMLPLTSAEQISLVATTAPATIQDRAPASHFITSRLRRRPQNSIPPTARGAWQELIGFHHQQTLARYQAWFAKADSNHIATPHPAVTWLSTVGIGSIRVRRFARGRRPCNGFGMRSGTAEDFVNSTGRRNALATWRLSVGAVVGGHN